MPDQRKKPKKTTVKTLISLGGRGERMRHGKTIRSCNMRERGERRIYTKT